MFSASGYAPEHMCVCKKPVKEEIPNQFMFELESNIASGQDGNGDRVTICPRCFLIYSDGGKDQKRKTFLKMVYEVSTYLLTFWWLEIASWLQLFLNNWNISKY